MERNLLQVGIRVSHVSAWETRNEALEMFIIRIVVGAGNRQTDRHSIDYTTQTIP
jgi:hypothetical protein